MQVPLQEADPCFSTANVWSLGPGRMLGVMLAAPHPHRAAGDGLEQPEVVVLKAFRYDRSRYPGGIKDTMCEPALLAV